MSDLPEWYYSVDGKQIGPVTGAELRRLAQSGEITPGDLVWKDGASAWKPAHKVKGLFPPSTGDGPPPVRAAEPPPLPAAERRPSGPPLDPVLAGVASLFLPPLGQLLLGQKIKALVLFLLAPVVIGVVSLVTFGAGVVLFPIYNLLAALDALALARRAREGAPIGPWEFGVPVVAGKDGASPPGLVAVLIGMTAASALPLVLGLVGLTRMRDDDLRDLAGLAVCVTIAVNGLVVAGLWVGFSHRQYRVVSVASLLVAGGWAFLLATRVPLGVILLGSTASAAAAGWGWVVLRRADVRAYLGAGGAGRGEDVDEPAVQTDRPGGRLARARPVGPTPQAGRPGRRGPGPLLLLVGLGAALVVTIGAAGVVLFARPNALVDRHAPVGAAEHPLSSVPGAAADAPGRGDAVSADDLADAYGRDAGAADAAYKGRPVVVTGVVTRHDTHVVPDGAGGFRPETSYALAGGRRLEVVCLRGAEDKDGEARVGRVLTVAGTCRGLAGPPGGAKDRRPHVWLSGCEVVSEGDRDPDALRAVALEDAYQNGRREGALVGGRMAAVYRKMPTPATARDQYRHCLRFLADLEENYAILRDADLRGGGPVRPPTEYKRGMAEALRETLAVAGIHR